MLFYIAVVVSVVSVLHAKIPPTDNRTERAKFVNSLIKPGDIGAEIGVASGVFAYHVLMKQQPSKLYLIDPWQYGLQSDMELDPTPEKQVFRDFDYKNVVDLFKPYPNIEVIRMKSEDAVVLFTDDYFDYVYIDGEHSYAAVTRDLNNYFSKVKVGGYLIGDDYGWTGVMDAVQDFIKSHENELLFGDDPYAGRTGGQFVIKRLR
jgi:hypothetical protein